MKKLKKLSIANLSEVELNERRMGQILGGKGGYVCQCGCHYQGQPEGSTDSSNSGANDEGDHHSDSCPQPEKPEPMFGNPCAIEPARRDAVCVYQEICDCF